MGTTVRVTGTNFDTAATSSSVEIRLDRRDGPSLASVAPTALAENGSFAVDVTVAPNTAIGNHILIATQSLANGQPCVGCPGRANFEVTGAGASASSNRSSAAVPPASEQNTSSSGPAAAPDGGAPEAAAAQPAASEPAAAQPASSEPAAAQSSAQTPAAQAVPSVQPPAAPPAVASRVNAARPADAAPAAPASSPPVAPAAPAPAPQASPGTPAPPTVGSSPASAPAGPALVGRSSAPQAPSPLPPRFSLVAGLVLVLLGLAAFWKSGRGVLHGDRRLTPAA
ncbi:MAG: hypothetical protein M3P85_10815 [Actinomycetota bacterium]|nr:hypothetical protein [Actinomycetota bacterium]